MNKWIVGAAAWMVAGAAGAEITLGAALGPIAVQLTDLDAADGIQPALTFNSGQAFGAVGATPPFSFNTHVSSSHAIYYSAAIDLSVNPMMASVGFIGNGTLQGASTKVDARTSLRDGSGTGFSLYAFTSESAYFTLSAHTQLQLVSQASASAQGSFSADGHFDRNFSSSAQIQISGNGGQNGDWEDVDDALRVGVGRSQSTFDEQGQRLLVVTFTNQTDKDIQVNVQSGVGVSGSALPVPEPDTWALLLCGAALAGVVARRRARRC